MLISLIPIVSNFIIATTGPRDAKIQELAKNNHQERLEKGYFQL